MPFLFFFLFYLFHLLKRDIFKLFEAEENPLLHLKEYLYILRKHPPYKMRKKAGKKALFTFQTTDFTRGWGSVTQIEKGVDLLACHLKTGAMFLDLHSYSLIEKEKATV
jgi:hypothetical protein